MVKAAGRNPVDTRYRCAYPVRMQPLYDHEAPKKPTNLSLNSDLLRQARDLGINLSAALEEALEDLVRRRRSEQWLAENRKAIEAYNEYFEKHSVFSDGLRSF